MSGKICWAFLIVFSTTLINGREAKDAFKLAPERWTIKIRGDREVAERIARSRGFEIYHEVIMQ